MKNLDKINIKAGNKGKVIILLHGWGVYKETWENLFPELSKHYIIYALDLPGFGNNQNVPPKFVLDDYVIFLNEFLEQKGIKKCILIGHSFGASIASLFTLTYPKKVEKLVLYSGGLALNNTVRRQQRLIIYSLIIFSVIVRWVRNKKISKNDYATLKNLYKSTHGKGEIVGKASSIHQPVLLIAGRYDFLARLKGFRNLKKLLPDSKLTIFNRSSHGAHREEKKKFLNTLQDFLK